MEDSIYRIRYRQLLALCVIALLCLGVAMVQSASMRVTGKLDWQWSEAGSKHFKFAIAGLITFVFVGRFDYARLARSTVWRNPTVHLLIAAAVTCVLVLIPHVGKSKNGARRWLGFGAATFQPSELAKWAVVIFLSWWLAYRPVDFKSFRKGFLPTFLPIAAITLLIVIQDFGTAALVLLCAIAMMLVGRVRARHLLIALPPILLAGYWFVSHKEYRWRRITAFIDPYSSPEKEGYHMIQSLLSFSTGGVLGRGLGNGIQKLGYLPEDTTDFIFAVICEELGLFGALLTIALYLGILFIGWQVVKQKRDSFGRLLAFGVATMTGLQALINIAVATVSAPTKGLSLPLVSAGGSGLIITCAALGLLYSACRFRHDAAQERSSALWEINSQDLAAAL